MNINNLHPGNSWRCFVNVTVQQVDGELVLSGVDELEPDGLIVRVRRTASGLVAGVDQLLARPYGARLGALKQMLEADLAFRGVEVPRSGISFGVEYRLPIAAEDEPNAA